MFKLIDTTPDGAVHPIAAAASHKQPKPGVLRPLADLQPGENGRVREMHTAGDDAERLKVMGVCTGRKVSVILRGDPMIVCVGGTRLGVSLRLAQRVLVAPASASRVVTESPPSVSSS